MAVLTISLFQGLYRSFCGFGYGNKISPLTRLAVVIATVPVCPHAASSPQERKLPVIVTSTETTRRFSSQNAMLGSCIYVTVLKIPYLCSYSAFDTWLSVVSGTERRTRPLLIPPPSPPVYICDVPAHRLVSHTIINSILYKLHHTSGIYMVDTQCHLL